MIASLLATSSLSGAIPRAAAQGTETQPRSTVGFADACASHDAAEVIRLRRIRASAWIVAGAAAAGFGLRVHGADPSRGEMVAWLVPGILSVATATGSGTLLRHRCRGDAAYDARFARRMLIAGSATLVAGVSLLVAGIVGAPYPDPMLDKGLGLLIGGGFLAFGGAVAASIGLARHLCIRRSAGRMVSMTILPTGIVTGVRW